MVGGCVGMMGWGWWVVFAGVIYSVVREVVWY